MELHLILDKCILGPNSIIKTVDTHGQARGYLPSEHGEREGKAPSGLRRAQSSRFAGGGGDASPYIIEQSKFQTVTENRMRCPACGNDETKGTLCSQCGTPVPSIDEKSMESKPAPPKKPASAASPPRKEGKHRSRPLHDLDVTTPEMDSQDSGRSRKENVKPKEERSFEVRDHRPKYDAGSEHPTPPPPKASPSPPPSGTRQEERPPVDFASFVFSLGASALMAMGETPIPGSASPQGGSTETPPADLVQAKELIDLIGILQEKTKGNLTSQESELITQTLYTLRMKYVQATKKI